MKRTFKTIFCVLTICAMVSFYGCGKKDDAGTSGTDSGSDTSQDADEGNDDK